MSENWASYSALTQHRTCPQAYMYDRIRKLESVVPEAAKVELEFGHWWHMLRAADSIERGRALGTLRKVSNYIRAVEDEDFQVATKVPNLTDATLEQADRWWRTLPSDIHLLWEERIGQDLPSRLAYADARYREMWEDERKHEHPVAVEMRWRRELPALPSGEDPQTVMIGYVDEIYYDDKRRMLVARDHKTSKDLRRQSVLDDMMDSQLQVYAWGASQEVAEWDHGPIRAVAYDRMRSVAPKPPTLTQGGRLSQRGGEPSVSGCDLTTYLSWANGPDGKGVAFPGTKKDGSGAGFYQAEEEVIERLDNEVARATWFQRTLTPLNRNIVATHLRGAVDTALDILRTKERVAATATAGRNLTRACQWCDFVKLCRAEMVGGADADYDLADLGLREKR